MSPVFSGCNISNRETFRLATLELFDLPAEDILFQFIFPWLSISQLWQCRRVSQGFRALVEEYFELCRRVDWSRERRSLRDSVFEQVMARSRCLLDLNVDNCACFTQAGMEMITENNTNVRRLSMRHCSQVPPWCVAKFLSRNAGLRKVDLGGVHNVSAAVCMMLAHNCQQLIFLNLEGAWQVNDTCLRCIAVHCKKLRRLSLRNCYAITDDGLFESARHWADMMYLDIRSCWRVTNRGVQYLTQFCQSLDELLVNDCRSVTEVSLFPLRRRKVKIDIMLPDDAQMTARLHRNLAFLQV